MGDARRQAKADRSEAKLGHRRSARGQRKPNPQATAKGPGTTEAGRLATLRERARRRMSSARENRRGRRDERKDNQVQRTRRFRQLANVRGRMHRRLVTSHMRYWGRRILSAVAALPVGAIGAVSTPLGRKLGAQGLMYPGRRVHSHLAEAALRARTGRSKNIRAAREAEVAALDTDEQSPVADRVPRAPHHHTPAATPATIMGDDGMSDPGFKFGEYTAAMEEAALKYDPDGMMQVLTTCEDLPEALTHVADTFKHLAERSDEEFPLEKEVGESLGEVYDLLMKTVSAAEDVGKTFRKVHEQDISRHEEPRVGEPKWDTTNND